MKKTAKRTSKVDWSRADAMTAQADPDNRPMIDEEWVAAARGTHRDWEQGRKEPDAAARAYLHLIAREPKTVRKALGRGSAAQPSPIPP